LEEKMDDLDVGGAKGMFIIFMVLGVVFVISLVVIAILASQGIIVL